MLPPSAHCGRGDCAAFRVQHTLMQAHVSAWWAHQGKVCLSALFHGCQVHQECNNALPAILGGGVDFIDQKVMVLLVALAMMVVQHLCTKFLLRLSTASICCPIQHRYKTAVVQVQMELHSQTCSNVWLTKPVELGAVTPIHKHTAARPSHLHPFSLLSC